MILSRSRCGELCFPSVTADPTKVKDRDARKQRLIEVVRAYAEREGLVPGIQRFARDVGAGHHTWKGQLWASWGDFIREAGLAPGEMKQPVPEDELLVSLALLTRRDGRFPSAARLKFARSERADIPSEWTFRHRFGGQAEMLERLRAWVADRPSEYADVAAILAATEPTRPKGGEQPVEEKTSENRVGTTFISDSLIPPAVDCLPGLAAGDAEIERQCAERGLTLSVELEHRVALAFQILGLDVNELGQGAGRVADGIARCPSGRWAVIYDAKVRRGGFTLGTEDRKFREYIEHHGEELQREGIDSIYFAVISSSFDKKDLAKTREVVRLTRSKAFALVEAAALRALVELKLRTRLLDNGATLERLLASPEVVDTEAVRALERG